MGAKLSRAESGDHCAPSPSPVRGSTACPEPAQCLSTVPPPRLSHCSSSLRWAVSGLVGDMTTSRWLYPPREQRKQGRTTRPCVQYVQMQQLESDIVQCIHVIVWKFLPPFLLLAQRAVTVHPWPAHVQLGDPEYTHAGDLLRNNCYLENI